MRIAVLGRSEVLLDAARKLATAGHEIALVGTCRSEAYYTAHESDFESFARDIGADFFCNPRVNSPEIVERLTSSRAELAVSWNWLTLIGAKAIAAFPHGILNIHAGDLPRYRGNAAPNWAILANEKSVGLCVHKMVPAAIDAGAVIQRDHFPLGPDTYIGEIYAWLGKCVPELLVRAVDAIASGSANWDEDVSDPSRGLRCYPRRPEDSRIDWRSSAEDIYRLVRSSSHPFAGALSTLEGERRLTVWRAAPRQHPGPFLAMPGQVLYAEEGDPVIATGSGVLRLTDIDLEGAADAAVAKTQVLKSLRQRLI